MDKKISVFISHLINVFDDLELYYKDAIKSTASNCKETKLVFRYIPVICVREKMTSSQIFFLNVMHKLTNFLGKPYPMASHLQISESNHAHKIDVN